MQLQADFGRLLAIALIVSASGCRETQRCGADTPLRRDGMCVTPDLDAGPLDGGSDAGPPDAGPCGGPCEGALGLCDPGTNTCVECLANSDCPDARPVCGEGGACTGCSGDDDCVGRAEALECDAMGGACTRCTVDNESALCGENSCDPVAGTCTTTPRGSVARCSTCLADSECASTDRCVVLSIPEGLGATPGIAYCQPAASAMTTCPSELQPYSRLSTERMTRSGQTASLCTIAETVTTCAAVLGFNGNCSAAMPSAMPCAQGGVCGTVRTTSNKCTYPCELGGDCPRYMDGATSFTASCARESAASSRFLCN